MSADDEFDLIVVGAGLAGSIVAARCAEAGMRTLVAETGRTVTQAPPVPGGLLERVRNKLASFSKPDPDGERWPSTLWLRSGPHSRWRTLRPVIARGPGGSARVYGAALGRARRDDFTTSHDPSNWHADASPPLPNAWPLDFDSFSGFYREAEAMLRPVGTRDPLDPDDDAELCAPPPISPAHGRIMDILRGNGRHPYRMHTGISYLPGCWECQGMTCPRNCKAHGFNRALAPVMAGGAPVELRERLTVRSIARDGNGTLLVHARDGQGMDIRLRGRRVVLAGGALNSPLVLQRSASLWDGGVPQLVGAGVMFHASEIFAVSGLADGTLHGPRKVMAFRDHYRDGAMPMAECQSLGMVPRAGMIATFLHDRLVDMGLPESAALQLALRIPASVAARRYSGSEMFTAALEDLPYAGNRIDAAIDGEGTEHIAITYAPAPEMLARVSRFRALMREAFAPLALDFVNQPGEPNLGHPMGSCRMGSEPGTSVVDPNGEVWHQPGLFVADASVFPSSLGINPALTVAANALRLSRELTA